MAIIFIYACSYLAWELLYKVSEEIIFQIFILININHAKYKIHRRFECHYSLLPFYINTYTYDPAAKDEPIIWE